MAEQLGLAVGTMLRNGTYRIDGILGQGGFGVTYLATDVTLDKIVAIKEFFPKNYCDREGNTNNLYIGTLSARDLVDNLKIGFLREARNNARLSHPNIVSIYAAFEENNTAYYVMEYVQGDSLSDIVKQHGPFPIRDAIFYIEKIGRALEYIHSKHINHLDVKPGNIMVDRSNNQPILIDFGLSKHYDSNGDETTITPMGISHGYAPMEQYNYGGIREFSPQSDLYSLAATLYYLLTGNTPPQAMALTEAPLTFPPTFPYHLISVIQRAMAPMKANRYNTISEFLYELAYVQPDSQFVQQDAGSQQPSQATVLTGSYVQSVQQQAQQPYEQQQAQQPYEQQQAQQSYEQQQVQQPYEQQQAQQPYEQQQAQQPYEQQPQQPYEQQQVQQPYEQEPPIVPPAPDNSPGYEDPDEEEEEMLGPPEKKSSSMKYIFIGLAAVIVIGLVIFFAMGSPGDDDVVYGITDSTGIAESTVPTVENLPYNTSLGDSEYTGEVDSDNLPDGKGKAVFKGGAGKEYDGEWKHGNMDGEATYLFANGDEFVGTFENNKFKHGKITIKESGMSFEGDFKDGQPVESSGRWTDKDGKEV